MNEQPIKSKVAIIGAGYVGTTFAYSLMISGVAHEIVIVDIDKEKAIGEVMDLNHGLPFVQPIEIYAGDYSDCKDAAILVIAAGASQKSGETRLDLLKKNIQVFKNIVNEILKHNINGILVVVTNPIDVLTYVTLKLSGFSKNRVIGSGTVLDSARFKFLLSKHCGIDPRNVHAYIIGEHGDSEVPVWSITNISGTPLDVYCQGCDKNCSRNEKEEIFLQVRDAAYQIISRKGATNYAISLALVRIVSSILRNENSVLTVSSLVEDYYGVSDVCLSVPCIVNRNGIARQIKPPLNEDEIKKFQKSAEILKGVIKPLNL